MERKGGQEQFPYNLYKYNKFLIFKFKKFKKFKEITKIIIHNLNMPIYTDRWFEVSSNDEHINIKNPSNAPRAYKAYIKTVVLEKPLKFLSEENFVNMIDACLSAK